MSKKSAGWLKRQVDKARSDVDEWPDWMKKTAGLEGTDPSEEAGSTNEGPSMEPNRRKKVRA